MLYIAWKFLTICAFLLYGIRVYAMQSQASQPTAPIVIESETSSDSVLVEWNYPNSALDKVQEYEVQYRKLGESSVSGWDTYIPTDAQNPTGLGLGVIGSHFREVQILRTRCDPSNDLSNSPGQKFKLSLNFLGQGDFNPETKTTTDWIPIDATAAQLEAYLESLSVVGDVNVIRGYETNIGHVDGANPSTTTQGSGGYTWYITFSWDHQDGPRHGWTFPNFDTANPTHIWPSPQGNFPLLSVVEHRITTPWSGPGLPVYVEEAQKGSKAGEIRACSSPKNGCRVEVRGLLPGTTYTFRIKAKNNANNVNSTAGNVNSFYGSTDLGGRGSLGARSLKDALGNSDNSQLSDKNNGDEVIDALWGIPGIESYPITTLPAAVPGTAPAPIVSSITSNSVSLQVKAQANLGNGLRLIGFDLQYRVHHSKDNSSTSTYVPWNTHIYTHNDASSTHRNTGDIAILGSSIPMVAVGGGGDGGKRNPNGIYSNGNTSVDSSYGASNIYTSNEERLLDANSIYMGSSTVPGLESSKQYSFRCRLVNTMGAGRWSAVKVVLTPASQIPSAPTSLSVSNVVQIKPMSASEAVSSTEQASTDLQPQGASNTSAPRSHGETIPKKKGWEDGHIVVDDIAYMKDFVELPPAVGEDYIRLSWSPEANYAQAARPNTNGVEGTKYNVDAPTEVVAYELQFREVSNTVGPWYFDKTAENNTFGDKQTFSLLRRSKNNAETPDNGTATTSIPSGNLNKRGMGTGQPNRAVSLISVVRSYATIGSAVTGGWFKLAMNMPGFSSIETSKRVITERLDYNASADEVKSAMEKLDSIGSLHRVEREGPDSDGSYKWFVTFETSTHAGDLPAIVVHSASITDGHMGVYEKQKGRRRTQLQTLTSTVRGLLPYKRYQFRVRAISASGINGHWSIPTALVRTLPKVLIHPDNMPAIATLAPLGGSGDVSLVSSPDGVQTPKQTDPDYAGGVGNGGSPGLSGSPGLVVITSYVYGSPMGQDQARWKNNILHKGRTQSVTFFYTEANGKGKIQTYTVPSSNRGIKTTSITIKVWGAGGGGGAHNNSNGGAGSFVQAKFRVVEGQTLKVTVGGGGDGATSGAAAFGGFGGGARGGVGDFGGGGGGGASRVELLTGGILIVASGGGGGGSTQYCCAHGGSGGGVNGTNGKSPTETPRNNSGGVARNEYGQNDPRDLSGFPARHDHLDNGQQPGAPLSVLATGGEGGSQSNGGKPGITGNWYPQSGGLQTKSTKEGDTGSFGGDIHMSTRIEKGGNSKPEYGKKGIGGRGGWGLEAGGGGGGGYYGGGGGGGGVDGAGGGGGSSFVSSLYIYVSPKTNTGVNAEAPVLSATYVDHMSVLLEWTKPVHHPSSAPSAYIIEMSEALNGGGEAFYQVYEANAKHNDAYNRDAFGPGTFSGGAWDDSQAVRSWRAEGLSSSTSFRFRVAALTTRGGLGDFSEAILVSTESKPTNTWRRIWPSASSSVEERKWPSPRSGHSSVMLGGFMYLFGGTSTGYNCDRSIGPKCYEPQTLYDHKGDVVHVSNDYVNHPDATLLPSGETKGRFTSNELWRFDTLSSEWELLETVTNNTAGLPNATAPPPSRDKHSAWVWRGDMYIFGGRLNVKDQIGMRDLWKLDPGHITEYVLNGGWNESLTDSKNTFSHIDSASSKVPSHRSLDEAGATLVDNTNLIPGGQCIIDIDVVINAPHSCARDLRVWLIAGGSKPNEDNVYTPGAYDARALLFDGSRIDFRNGIRPGINANIDTSLNSDMVDGCGDPNGGLLGTVFDDEATHKYPGHLSSTIDSNSNNEWGTENRDGPRQACTTCINSNGPCQNRATRECHGKVHDVCPVGYTDCSEQLLHSGSVIPEEPLSRFHGIEASALWKLRILDTSNQKQDLEGTLTSWQLRITTQPCEAKYSWTEVDQSYNGQAAGAKWPSTRFSHTTASVGDFVFIWSGVSSHLLKDLWRLNMNTDPTAMRWTKLTPHGGLGQENFYGYSAPTRYGATMLNSPWRFLSIGGLNKVSPSGGVQRYINTLQQYDPISRAWGSISTSTNTNPQHKRHRVNAERETWSNPRNLIQPTGRAYHSAVLVGARNTTSRDRGIGTGSLIPSLKQVFQFPRILLFGGYDGTTVLDELWELQLGSMDHRIQQAVEDKHREDICKSRVRGEAENKWILSCQENLGLANEPPCSIDDIMTRMWCTGPGSAYMQQPNEDSGSLDVFQPEQAFSVVNF